MRVKSLVQFGTAIAVAMLMLAANSMTFRPEDALSWRKAKAVAWTPAALTRESAATNAALKGFGALVSAPGAHQQAAPAAASIADGCLITKWSAVWLVNADHTRNHVGFPTPGCDSKAVEVESLDSYPMSHSGMGDYFLDQSKSADACKVSACSMLASPATIASPPANHGDNSNDDDDGHNDGDDEDSYDDDAATANPRPPNRTATPTPRKLTAEDMVQLAARSAHSSAEAAAKRQAQIADRSPSAATTPPRPPNRTATPAPRKLTTEDIMRLAARSAHSSAEAAAKRQAQIADRSPLAGKQHVPLNGWGNGVAAGGVWMNKSGLRFNEVARFRFETLELPRGEPLPLALVWSGGGLTLTPSPSRSPSPSPSPSPTQVSRSCWRLEGRGSNPHPHPHAHRSPSHPHPHPHR